MAKNFFAVYVSGEDRVFGYSQFLCKVFKVLSFGTLSYNNYLYAWTVKERNCTNEICGTFTFNQVRYRQNDEIIGMETISSPYRLSRGTFFFRRFFAFF